MPNNIKKYTILTLGSHSALQILKGAYDEGFNTSVVAIKTQANLYRRFPFVNKVIEVDTWHNFINVQKKFSPKTTVVVPHGSFVAHFGIAGNTAITLPYFGNKKALEWEASRDKQRIWLDKARIHLTAEYSSYKDKMQFPVIVKLHGAAGGRGYFLAKNKTDLKQKASPIKESYSIQQYIIGVTMYIHYFYSPLTKKLEILSMDRRYETNVDGLGRIPHIFQKQICIEPSYVVVGNSPLSLRESMLEQAFQMGERVVEMSQKIINKKGMYGPFCLETVITPDLKIYTIEISTRIVAGTNLFVDGSPYSYLLYNEPMSTGRRIAREIKLAIKKKKLSFILD